MEVLGGQLAKIKAPSQSRGFCFLRFFVGGLDDADQTAVRAALDPLPTY